MTLRQIEQRLCDAGIENYRHEAMLLAEHFCGIPRSSLIIMRDDELPGGELETAVMQRAKRYPLQYILGEWTFLGERYRVTPDCLIPRPETEQLAMMGVRLLPKEGRLADLCSGSGCIGISVMLRRTDCTCTAIEKYPRTMELTEENARAHKVDSRMEFITADVTKDCLCGEYDVILSNPPYVTADEMESLEAELSFEPEHALTDGGDGLSIIRSIIELYPPHLSPGGTLGLEIGAGQGEAVLQIAEKMGIPGEIIPDEYGKDRFFVYRRPAK